MNLIDLCLNTRKDGLDKVKQCLASGVDVNYMIHHKTALMAAAINSNTISTESTVQLLIDAGADLEARNCIGETILSQVVRHVRTTSTLATVIMLLNAGADVNSYDTYYGKTVLSNAICSGAKADLINILFNAGADISDELFDAFAYYVDHKNKETTIIRMLIAAGADIEYKDAAGITVLFNVIDSAFHHKDDSINEIINIIDILLNAGADVNSQNNDLETVLMYASSGHHISIVKILLDAGADINCKDCDGLTALIRAVMEDKATEEIVKLLINAGADTTDVFKHAHKDNHKILYECLVLPGKLAFGLGQRDSQSIVSKLPWEICKVILDFVK